MNFQDFQKVIKEEVSLDEMDSIMDIVNYTESVKDSEFASEDELATELKEMLNSIGLDFDSEALTAMEDSVEIPLTYMDDGSAEAILSVFAQDGEGKEIDGELTLKIERLGEGKFDATILAKFGEDEAKELGDIEFELAEESEDVLARQRTCYSCGVNRATKTTEDGDPICKDCSDYYAIGGPGENELDEEITQDCPQCRGTGMSNYGKKDASGVCTCKQCKGSGKTSVKEEITDDDDFEDGYDPIYEAKAVSVSQQRAAGAALAAKRGDVPVSKLVGASKEMYDSMSEKELRKMARVKHSQLNEEEKESNSVLELNALLKWLNKNSNEVLDKMSRKELSDFKAQLIRIKKLLKTLNESEEKDNGMEDETTGKENEVSKADETPVEETEKKYIMSEKELRAVVSWLLKNEDKIEATEEGIDGAVAEIEATFADEFEEGEEEMPEGEPKPEDDDDEMPMMEPEEDPNSPVEIYEEVRYDAAWNVILYKPHKRYFISKLFGKDEVKSKNDIENYVKKNYPDFMIFHIFDITEVF